MPSVPFHPQKWDLSRWRELGFASEQDAEYWERSCCGILCLQMAAEHWTDKRYRTVDLIEQGRALDAYTDATGWSHAGLVRLAGELGMEVRSGAFAPNFLAEAVEAGKLAVVSIKWGFYNRKTPRERLLFWKKYGGHLALVIGAKRENGRLAGFYVHHTSIREGYNWENRFVPLRDFKRGYTGRAILLAKA